MHKTIESWQNVAKDGKAQQKMGECIWVTTFVQIKMVNWSSYHWVDHTSIDVLSTSTHTMRCIPAWQSSVPYTQYGTDWNMQLPSQATSTDVQRRNVAWDATTWWTADTQAMALSGIATNFWQHKSSQCICCWTSLHICTETCLCQPRYT